MDKLYYTIGEVAGILGENTSLVRFWTNNFSKFLNPKRNAKGNRLYTAEEVETLKQIHLLVKKNGMTLEGAGHQIEAQRRKVSCTVQTIDSLKEIRRQLMEIYSFL